MTDGLLLLLLRLLDREAASIKSNLLRLYSTTFQEGRKQLRMLVLQITDLQKGYAFLLVIFVITRKRR